MNIIKWLILSNCFAALAAGAQSTIVTATVVDSNAVVWANGNYTLQFVPNPNAQGSPTWNGNPFPNTQWTYSGVLDSNGQFSRSVPSNNFIAPAGSTYTVTICPNTSAPCTVILQVTFQGTTQDISVTITNAIQPMAITALPVPRAYTDTEMAVSASQAGYIYQNVVANTPRYWNGASWSNFGGTLSSISIASFPPLFSTSNVGTATNPSFTFTAQNVIANLVYANCTGSSTAPAFCALTAAMLPANITSNTSGNAATATTALQFTNTPSLCTGSLYAKGVGAAGNASCASIAFTNIAGNISTSQMNNGTNADSSHWFRGDGQWATLPAGPSGHDYYFNYNGCTITNGSNLNNCTATITWSSVGLSGATIATTDYLGCTVDTFNAYTASWSLGGTGMSSSNFQYYWTEIMANSGTTSTPTISCHLHTAA